MTARMQLLGRFRERWTSGALPLVVEHRADRPEHVCAAPSLWMGGRELAAELSELGLGPGQVLELAVPLGIRWVQGLIGALRVGAAVTPASQAGLEPAARLGADGLEPVTPGTLTTSRDTAWLDEGGDPLSRDELDALVPSLASRWTLTEGLRVLGRLTADRHSDLAASLAVLHAEGELHVLPDHDPDWPRSLHSSTPELQIGFHDRPPRGGASSPHA